MGDFVLRARSTVSIISNKPFPGRVTILYTPPSGYQARSMELPQAAFLEACRNLADRMSAPTNGVHHPENETPEPKPAIKTLVRPVSARA